jgi:hypothetical protein
MRDAHTIEKLPLHIWLFLLINKALKLSDLADLLVQHDFAFVIAVDGHTCRVIASVLEARKTRKQDIHDISSVAFDEVIEVAKDAAMVMSAVSCVSCLSNRTMRRTT